MAEAIADEDALRAAIVAALRLADEHGDLLVAAKLAEALDSYDRRKNMAQRANLH